MGCPSLPTDSLKRIRECWFRQKICTLQQIDDNRSILDGTARLWCVNAGQARERIAEAVKQQVLRLNYSPAFQMAHPGAFERAERLVKMIPGNFDRLFLTN